MKGLLAGANLSGLSFTTVYGSILVDTRTTRMQLSSGSTALDSANPTNIILP